MVRILDQLPFGNPIFFFLELFFTHGEKASS